MLAEPISIEDESPIYNRVLTFKQEFNKPIGRIIRNNIEQGKQTEVILLLCPSYPHDGERFVYDSDELMTGEAAPTLPIFMKRTDLLIHTMKDSSLPTEGIIFKPMICEIEQDLPNVLERFAKGSQNYFRQSVDSTVEKTTQLMKSRYPNQTVEGSNFSAAMNDLEEIQLEVTARIMGKIEDGTFNKRMLDHAQHVAHNRNYMFQHLYGETSKQGFMRLALRQMCNYLAVMKAIALQSERSAIILNMQTPNSFYVTQKSQTIRPILEVDQHTPLPIFYFF